MLTSRKSSSTPSLPEATDVKTSVASTEQAASADNLAAKQAAETIAESVLSVARAEAIVAVTSESQAANNDSELSVVVHPLRDPHHDLSTINNSSDLATIVESLALCDTKPPTRRQHSCTDERPNTSDMHKANMVLSSSASNLNKSFYSNRNTKISNTQAAAAAAQNFVEAVEALDKIREGSDILRNSTNSFLSGDLQATIANEPISMVPTSQGVRISVSTNLEGKEDKPGKDTPSSSTDTTSTKDASKNESNNARNSNNCPIVVTNPMSVSVPNLTSTEANSQIEPTAAAGLLETFAALARRRTLGSVSSTNTSNSHSNNANAIMNSNTQNNQNSGSLFPRGPNSVSSLVRLALSSNFPGGLLSTAQSYPSLSSSNNTSAQQGGIPTTAGTTQGLTQALTMSLTSTSSDSEQVSLEDFLESCRAPTLLAELDDDEDMGEEEDNDEDENEDDADYEEVMVSRSLLSFMEEEGYESRPSKRRSWDDEYVLKRQFSALIPAFDPRPGRTNVNQTTGKALTYIKPFHFCETVYKKYI